jgi:hypothetical protein
MVRNMTVANTKNIRPVDLSANPHPLDCLEVA